MDKLLFDVLDVNGKVIEVRRWGVRYTGVAREKVDGVLTMELGQSVIELAYADIDTLTIYKPERIVR